MKPLQIAYICMDDGGCAYYRSILPFETIKKKEKLSILALRKGCTAAEIEKSLNANVIQIGRTAPQNVLREHFQLMQRMGIKLVLEYDDNIWAVNPYSPHYIDFGTEEFTDELTGIKIWEHGKNGFDIESNKSRLKAVEDTCSMVDAVTVTQPYLQQVFSQFSNNVIVLPNCVDPSNWTKLDIRRKTDEIRLFWAGGCSHYVDWLYIIEPLKEIMERYKNVKLVIMGQAFKGALEDLPQDRVEFHSWVHFDAYPFRVSMLDPDIALIPLEDNIFNRCKSNIKWVEMSALGIPSVVSAVSPYIEHYNGNNMVAVDNQHDAWVKGISTLIEDRLLGAKIAGEAQKTVMEKFDINKEYRQYLDAYQGIVNAA